MATKRRTSPPPRGQAPRAALPAKRGARGATPLSAVLYLVAVVVSLFLVARHASSWARYVPGGHSILNTLDNAQSQFEAIVSYLTSTMVDGHADFGDGRSTRAPSAFCTPYSDALYHVNVMLGNGGPEPDLSGGMIPSVAPPFAMTRWTPQTRQNYVSMCPYNQTDTRLHGFIGTHQPAVWMGESGPAQVAAGLGAVVTDFDKRGLNFKRQDEYASVNYYSNVLRGENGDIDAELAQTSRAGHLRFTFRPNGDAAPYIVLDASRATVITHNPKNVTFPAGKVTIDKKLNEVYGWSSERQDNVLVGEDLPAKRFKGYFVARFSKPFVSGGISHHGKVKDNVLQGEGEVLSSYVTFAPGTEVVEVRVGVSFISIKHARRNLDYEVPDGQTLEETSLATRTALADKLDRLSVSGATTNNKTVLYTGLSRTLVYPYEVSENAASPEKPMWRYYSGYIDMPAEGISYSGYSIWDTFRATTAWQLFIAPERIPGMINSMLQDFQQGGWLPMWKNIVETNIMVGTHADSVIAQAMRAGVRGFNYDLAWQAVKKDAFTPPDRDTELKFFDREEHTPQEVRAGLTEYMKLGYVADDLHSESGSRTLDYAYDDHAASIVARTVGADTDAEVLEKRAQYYRNLWNPDTGFMEAKNSDGSWAGETAGWTEGDHWAYSLNVMHDVPGLIRLMGGPKNFVDFLDRHFAGGHNLHTNEPSHHIPYLYSFAAPHKAQEAVLKLGQEEYNHTDIGLSGNEDCGQMSAWYLFSAMGFYPVDPASATYVVGTPFFDYIALDLPAGGTIRVTAKGASSGKKKYIKNLTIDGRPHKTVIIDHSQLAHGADLVFEMSDTPQTWPAN